MEATTEKTEQEEVKTDVNQENIENVEKVETEIEQPAELSDDEKTLAYLREKGIEVNSFEDLKKVPEKVIEKVEVNPYEDILDDDDKAYLTFKKETGRGRKEYELLNANLDEVPRIFLAREKVRKETGLQLSDEQVDEYLADSLGIDVEDMSTSDQIKLASYTKDVLDAKKSEQEKYRKPAEQKPAPANEDKNQNNYVTLENGAVMLKSDYDKINENRLKEIEKAKTEVNSVTSTAFKITIDDNGTPKDLIYPYEYSEEDKHSMLSIVSNIDEVVKTRYRSENGFNHKQFGEDMQWSDQKFREKAIASLVHKARAEAIEEVLKQRGNVNYDTNQPLQRQTKDGVRIVSMADAAKGII